MKKRYPKSRGNACLFACLLLTLIQFKGTAAGATHFTTPNAITHISRDTAAGARSNVYTPIRFLRFSAFGSNGKVSIGWKVTNEKDQFEYIIERSVDGIDFVPVGTLIYKSNITPVNNYSFTDLAPVTNHANFYRVRSVDVNGRATVSKVAKVRLSTPVGALFLNPSPADESASLSLVSKSRGTVSLRIVNQSGRTCWHLHYSVTAGPNVLLLDGLDKLPGGAYTVQCVDGRKTRQVQLTIQHQK